MEAASIPWGGLRASIERLASDPESIRELDVLRDGLNDLLGLCDTHLASFAKLREAQARAMQEAIALAYEAADAREGWLHSGEVTAIELDEAGVRTREDLDRLAEEGLLEVTVGAWVEGLHLQPEEAFNPLKHPRDRLGRWAESAAAGPRGAGEPSKWTPPDTMSTEDVLPADPYKIPDPHEIPDPKLSPAVAAIKAPKDAENYFGTLGMKADLKGIDDVNALQQVAQAVTDARKKFPALTGTGRMGPLAGVRTVSAIRSDIYARELRDMLDESGDSLWALTGPDPTVGKGNPAAADVPASIDPDWYERGYMGGSGNASWITLNDGYQDENGGGFGEEYVHVSSVGLAAAADHNPYGRMMHELGHAVAATEGVAFEHGGNGVTYLLREAGVGPYDLAKITEYGASSAPEGWAEVFATLNVPGALEQYPQELQEKLKHLRTIANKGGRKLL